ncbi:MAG: serine/threonine-protein kinase [Polyangiaceae bacterium]
MPTGSSPDLPGTRAGANTGLEFESTVAHRALDATPRTGSSTSSAEAALAQDDVDRTRLFLAISIAMPLVMIAPLPFLGGDAIAKWIFAASAAGVALGGAWLLWLLRRRQTQDAEWPLVLVGTICGACGCAWVYYDGVFSPAGLVLLFGVAFMSGQRSFLAGLWVYLQCAIFHLAASLAIFTGVLADRGVFRPAPVATRDFVVTELAVQLILVTGFAFARATRSTALRAIMRLEGTVREAAMREALLLEARADLARALQVGGPGRYTDQTLGSFTLGPLIGRGGMSEVYEARRDRTGEVAAVKMLHRHLLVDGDNVARFVREARIVASLESDHVVKVMEVSDEKSPVPFLAMERLYGRDLADVLHASPKLGAQSAVDLITQVARGVAQAHSAGIVHRDLKPQNVFRVEREGRPHLWKVLDFGLSKLVDQSANLTRGQVLGTPTYMAPEQARGAEVDARADVYALGAIAYRVITGHPPYQGTDMMAVLLEVVSRMPPRPRAVAQDVPEQVERALMVALAKDPGDRFPTVGELATAIEAAFAGKLDPRIVARATTLATKHPWRAGLVPGGLA